MSFLHEEAIDLVVRPCIKVENDIWLEPDAVFIADLRNYIRSPVTESRSCSCRCSDWRVNIGSYLPTLFNLPPGLKIDGMLKTDVIETIVEEAISGIIL